MKLIYCATPSRLSERTTEIMDFVTEKHLAPFHPFQAFEYKRFEGGYVGRKKTIEFCCRAIDMCDEFWLFGISQGTLIELCHAIKKQKLIRLVYGFDVLWKKEYERLKDVFGDPLKPYPFPN